MDDHIRSFGMSGFMITDELKSIEERFSIELGHVRKALSDSPAEYYPQFEQSVRAEAAVMSGRYELFYCLENAIRKLISETLQESAGTNWWDSGKIPPNIVQEVKDRIQKEVDSGVTRRSDAAIDYTTFGELSVIITSNWDIFGTIFSSRRAVEKVMSSLNLLRGPIAHCCPLSEDEVDRLQLTVKDWFRMIG
ncbi:MAG: Swt1 family HEPN domain-containing protein [Gammaproteobacteria bacterium]|nr:Swt1 family HEPN domain-containing protein [Gammaproteobacteria bacterium]